MQCLCCPKSKPACPVNTRVASYRMAKTGHILTHPDICAKQQVCIACRIPPPALIAIAGPTSAHGDCKCLRRMHQTLCVSCYQAHHDEWLLMLAGMLLASFTFSACDSCSTAIRWGCSLDIIPYQLPFLSPAVQMRCSTNVVIVQYKCSCSAVQTQL